jgi:two-component system, NarL family, sensor histidine kinase UhpB
MRLALKHQILLAPASVLLLMSLLLGFLQFNYWDLSLKRQAQRKLGTLFIAVAEADLATQRMYNLAVRLGKNTVLDASRLQEMAELHTHLSGASQRILEVMMMDEATRRDWRQAVSDLDPENGFNSERFLQALGNLRPHLDDLSEVIQVEREKLRDVHSQDIDDLVARTTFVSIVVLGAAILIGIFLSLTLARRILKRIQLLSDSAGRIVRGELSPPPAPEVVRDELDDLALSINRMTDQLIRVVGTEKLLEGAEEERRRIAMDIHDQTLSDLSAIHRGLQALEGGQDPNQIRKLGMELQRAMSNLREVMDNLHPQTLEILGFSATLQSHVEQLQAKSGQLKLNCYISHELEGRQMPRLISLTLYRIAVEAIHNVVKHSRAGSCEVNLEARGEWLNFSVEDNGIGISQEQSSGQGGRGLNNIRERARAIGARARWSRSRFSTGTRFELSMPMSKTQEQG